MMTQGNKTMQVGSSQASGFKNQIAFKSKTSAGERTAQFKAGGPIRATGAAIEKMDNLIQTNNNTFSNTQSSFKNSHTPQGLGGKMPARPGSSKPI